MWATGRHRLVSSQWLDKAKKRAFEPAARLHSVRHAMLLVAQSSRFPFRLPETKRVQSQSHEHVKSLFDVAVRSNQFSLEGPFFGAFFFFVWRPFFFWRPSV